MIYFNTWKQGCFWLFQPYLTQAFWSMYSLGVGQNCPDCHKSTLANDLIMELDQLVDQVKWGLLVYICCHSTSKFCWHQQKSAKISIAKGIFLQNKNSFFVFFKKDMIANKLFFQNICIYVTYLLTWLCGLLLFYL